MHTFTEFNVRHNPREYFVQVIDSRQFIQAGSRNPDFFDDDFEEATRLLRMHMHVTDVDESIPSADPKRPTLQFVGSMRGFSALEHSDRTVQGHVRVMPGGDIRWSFVRTIHALLMKSFIEWRSRYRFTTAKSNGGNYMPPLSSASC